MSNEVTAADRESIARVLDVLEQERRTVALTPLAVLWGDWHESLTDLAEGTAASA